MYEYRKLSPEQREEVVRARRERGYPDHQPPHPHREERHYLITAACYEHRYILDALERRQDMLGLLFDKLLRADIELCGWVVMGNHYHLLVRVERFEMIGQAVRQAHGASAREWNALDGTPGRKVWYRYSDRAIRSEAHYYTTLNYIHYNPVHHGTAPSPYEWDWSSVHWYLAHRGREWLQDLWRRYPLRDYGKGWDEA